MKRNNPRAGLAPPLAACLAACVLCLAAAPAPQQGVKPAPGATRTTVPTPPAPSPTSRPATAPVQSEIGQTLIRAEAGRGAANDSAADSATAPARTPGFDVPKVVGALALVLGLIFALRFVLKRSLNPAAVPATTNAVQVLTRSPLAPRQQLLLVRVGRRLLVVADCNGQLNALSELTDPDEVAALVGQIRDEKPTTGAASFGNLLGKLRRGSDDGHSTAGTGGVADDEEFPRVPNDVPELARGRRVSRPSGEDSGDEGDVSVVAARDEIQGLMERVRLISHQFKRS